MIITEAALREQLRQPRMHARVQVPRGASLSPAAQDLVAHWRLELQEVDTPEGTEATWDRPGAFPVALDGAPPTCITCGSVVASKPDHLTQLNAYHFAPKTAPRIRLRGQIDLLQARSLLIAARASTAGEETLATSLGSVAAYCRELLAAEYNERPAALVELDGLDDVALRSATHDPQSTFGIDHLVPSTEDPELLHWLNLLRCEVREVEIVALDTFPSPHDPCGASVVRGLNRLSSAIYYLELKLVSAEVSAG